jgi:hypothetical protein
MTSTEVSSLCRGFLSQVRGIFTGLERLPDVFAELERREQELEKREEALRQKQELLAKRKS